MRKAELFILIVIIASGCVEKVLKNNKFVGNISICIKTA